MPVVTRDMVPVMLSAGASARVDAEVKPRFEPGDPVVTRNINPAGHTRLPRYARAKRGVVERDHGVFIFPDSHAHGRGQKPQHLYSVRFEFRELWGQDASERDRLYLDLWDDYLESPSPVKSANTT